MRTSVWMSIIIFSRVPHMKIPRVYRNLSPYFRNLATQPNLIVFPGSPLLQLLEWLILDFLSIDFMTSDELNLTSTLSHFIITICMDGYTLFYEAAGGSDDLRQTLSLFSHPPGCSRRRFLGAMLCALFFMRHEDIGKPVGSIDCKALFRIPESSSHC